MELIKPKNRDYRLQVFISEENRQWLYKLKTVTKCSIMDIVDAALTRAREEDIADRKKTK